MLLTLRELNQLFINSKEFLGLGLIIGRRVDIKMHQMRVGLGLRKPSWGISFPKKVREDKVREFLTLKNDLLRVNEYG